MSTCLQNLNNIVNMFTKLIIAVSEYSQKPVTSYTHTMFGKAEGKQFPEVFFTTVAVLFTALKHFTCFHSLRF